LKRKENTFALIVIMRNDEYEDIPLFECQKEKEIAEKIRKELLPQQKVKFRFVRD